MTRPAGSPTAPYRNFCKPGLLIAISCRFAPTVKAKKDPKPTYAPEAEAHYHVITLCACCVLTNTMHAMTVAHCVLVSNTYAVNML